MSRLECPLGHDEKYFTTDADYEIVWCRLCGDEKSYEFNELKAAQPTEVPYKYHILNPFTSFFKFFTEMK